MTAMNHRRLPFALRLLVTSAALAASACAADPPQPFESDVQVAFLDRIDDLNDGDDAILALGFRTGFWYAFNDGTPGAKQSPTAMLFTTTPGGPSDKGYCARSYGMGFEAWGAGMGLDLNDTGEVVNGIPKRAPYDATAYKGIAFAARGVSGKLRFAVSTAATELMTAGGTCMGGTTSAACSDTHGVDIPLTPEWRTYAVPFDRLTQEGFGAKTAFDQKKIMALYFNVASGNPFDYAIDDVGFFR
jgi:hypothetical protein